MKAVIKIEAIGENTYRQFDYYNILRLNKMLGLPNRSYWVAQILGFHLKYHYERKFLHPKVNYRKSNGVGSRGIHLWYTLESGNLYEIKRPLSWQRFERFFFTVTETGEIEKLSEDEANKWLGKSILD